MTLIALIVRQSPPQRLFTVGEYLRMVEIGILTEADDVELLEVPVRDVLPA